MEPNFTESFKVAQKRDEETKLDGEKPLTLCDWCNKPLTHCACTRHTGIGWLETETSGV